MTFSLDEAIKHCEEVAEELEEEAVKGCCDDTEIMNECIECASNHRQLAEWLKELKESRMVLDILGQFLVDADLDVCCEDLVMEDDYCEKNCDNRKPLCWYRWAKMKARGVKSDGDSN